MKLPHNDDKKEMAQQLEIFASQGKLKPLYHAYDVEHVQDAYHSIANRKVKGKAIIVWNQSSKL